MSAMEEYPGALRVAVVPEDDPALVRGEEYARFCELALAMYRDAARKFLTRVMEAGAVPDSTPGTSTARGPATQVGTSEHKDWTRADTVWNRFKAYRVGSLSTARYDVDLFVCADGRSLYRRISRGSEPTTIVEEIAGSNVLGLLGRPWPFLVAGDQDLIQLLTAPLPSEEQLRDALASVLHEVFSRALAAYIPQA